MPKKKGAKRNQKGKSETGRVQKPAKTRLKANLNKQKIPKAMHERIVKDILKQQKDTDLGENLLLEDVNYTRNYSV